MAALHLFLVVLGLAKASLSNLRNADILQQMIAEQSRKCPYIALCHTPNSSVYQAITSSFHSPCCKECSCKDTCVEDDSCCPDYFLPIDNPTTTEKPHEITMDQIDTKAEIDRKDCVKIQHGRIQNQNGFIMVASCPSSYNDIVVQRKCEMELDYNSQFDLFDHVPVTDAGRGQAYKNRFCWQCNMPANSSCTFWHIELICQMMYLRLELFPIKDVFTFLETLVLDRSKMCNIHFRYGSTGINVNATPTSCTYNNIIDTCNKDTSDDDLLTLCNAYTWPIQEKGPESRVYRNYACMLCNGVNIREPCMKPTKMRNFTIQFTNDFNSTQKLTTPNNISRSDQQIINRFFPNKYGEVHCRKGFVYDPRKGTCRLVFCPLYFVVSDGECVPLFSNLDDVDYYLLLQTDVTSTSSTQGLKEATLTKRLYDIFHEHLGDELSGFFIWKNQNIPVKDRYFVMIVVSGNFSHGRYVSILKFTNLIIQRTFTFDEDSSVVFSVNTTIALQISGRDFQLTRNVKHEFVLIDSYKKEGTDMKEEWRKWRTPMYISPNLLCYRILLLDNEVRAIGTNTHAFVRGRILHSQNIQKVASEKGFDYIVCLDHWLQNIAETISIFVKEDSTNYKFISKQRVNKRKNVAPTIQSDENESDNLNKSLVATVATVALVAFIVIFRRVMKRLNTQ